MPMVGRGDLVGVPEILHAPDRKLAAQRARRRGLGRRLRAEQLRFAQPVGLSDEAGHELRGRAVIDDLRRVVLLHAAAVENGDAVAHAHGLGLVVGDENGGDAQRRGQRPQLMAHLLPEEGVQRGERLVEQDAPRMDRDGPGERHPLLLPAGELVRIAALKVLQPDGAQRRAHPALQILGIPFCPQAEGRVFKHRHVGPEGEVLKDEAQPPLFRRQVDPPRGGKDADVVQPELAAVRRLQPGDHPQQRGLAAAGRPQQRGEAAVLHGQRGGADDLSPRKALFNLIQSDLHNIPRFLRMGLIIGRGCKVGHRPGVKSA